jgi:hypothetical protein
VSLTADELIERETPGLLEVGRMEVAVLLFPAGINAAEAQVPVAAWPVDGPVRLRVRSGQDAILLTADARSSEQGTVWLSDIKVSGAVQERSAARLPLPGHTGWMRRGAGSADGEWTRAEIVDISTGGIAVYSDLPQHGEHWTVRLDLPTRTDPLPLSEVGVCVRIAMTRDGRVMTGFSWRHLHPRINERLAAAIFWGMMQRR